MLNGSHAGHDPHCHRQLIQSPWTRAGGMERKKVTGTTGSNYRKMRETSLREFIKDSSSPPGLVTELAAALYLLQTGAMPMENPQTPHDAALTFCELQSSVQ